VAHTENVLQIVVTHQESMEVRSTKLAQPVEKVQVVHVDNLDAHLESQLVETTPQHMENEFGERFISEQCHNRSSFYSLFNEGTEEKSS